MKKNILLTGATGYLGSKLANALVSNGYKLIILKRKSSSLSRILSIIADVTIFDVENLDYSELFDSNVKIDVIIHTAANYGRNNETSNEVFEANVRFPMSLIEAATNAGVSNFINTDTVLDKYLNSYALSKSQLVDWGKVISKIKKITFVNMRLEHFYGPGDSETKFTTYVMNNCIRGVSEIKLTSGEQKRDFIYIDDVVSAYLTVLQKIDGFADQFKEFDVGSGKVLSIRELVEKIRNLTGSETHLAFNAVPIRAGEIMCSCANVEPLNKLGWFCRTNLDQGLKLMIEGYYDQ